MKPSSWDQPDRALALICKMRRDAERPGRDRTNGIHVLRTWLRRLHMDYVGGWGQDTTQDDIAKLLGENPRGHEREFELRVVDAPRFRTTLPDGVDDVPGIVIGSRCQKDDWLFNIEMKHASEYNIKVPKEAFDVLFAQRGKAPSGCPISVLHDEDGHIVGLGEFLRDRYVLFSDFSEAPAVPVPAPEEGLLMMSTATMPPGAPYKIYRCRLSDEEHADLPAGAEYRTYNFYAYHLQGSDGRDFACHLNQELVDWLVNEAQIATLEEED